jgi:hypothetical protein
VFGFLMRIGCGIRKRVVPFGASSIFSVSGYTQAALTRLYFARNHATSRSSRYS